MVRLHLTVRDNIHAAIKLSSIIFKTRRKNTKKCLYWLIINQNCNNTFKNAKI